MVYVRDGYLSKLDAAELGDRVQIRSGYVVINDDTDVEAIARAAADGCNLRVDDDGVVRGDSGTGNKEFGWGETAEKAWQNVTQRSERYVEMPDCSLYCVKFRFPIVVDGKRFESARQYNDWFRGICPADEKDNVLALPLGANVEDVDRTPCQPTKQ